MDIDEHYEYISELRNPVELLHEILDGWVYVADYEAEPEYCAALRTALIGCLTAMGVEPTSEGFPIRHEEAKDNARPLTDEEEKVIIALKMIEVSPPEYVLKRIENEDGNDAGQLMEAWLTAGFKAIVGDVQKWGLIKGPLKNLMDSNGDYLGEYLQMESLATRSKGRDA